jgi:hypothetical protein
MENKKIIGINYKHQIEQVNEITNKELKKIELNKEEGIYPFNNFDDEKILTYCYEETEYGIKIYPYKKRN